MNLQDLPTEILTECFKYFTCTYTRKLTNEELKALRLTSKRLEAISAPLLAKVVFVYISSDSLARLEDISRHPVFSKSIRTVQISLSFYDATLANDFTLFAVHCKGRRSSSWAEWLHQLLWIGSDEEFERKFQNTDRISDERRALA